MKNEEQHISDHEARVMGIWMFTALFFLFLVFENAHNKEFNNDTCCHGAYHIYNIFSTTKK